MIMWTIVTRDPKGRFFRPVAGAPKGPWSMAAAAAYRTNAPGSVDLWYVPCQGQGSHAEDIDNILLPSGKRVPIRWDAAPKWRYVG